MFRNTVQNSSIDPRLLQGQVLQTSKQAYDLQKIEQVIFERAIGLSEEEMVSKNKKSKPGLQKKYVKMIPNMKVKSTSQHCTICQEHFKEGTVWIKSDQIIKKFPCKHILHKQCAKNWLKISAKCTVCRLDLAHYYRQQQVTGKIEQNK